MQQAVAFGSSHALALRPTKVHTAPRGRCVPSHVACAKKNIHPEWFEESRVICNGEEVLVTSGTKPNYTVEIWSGNHPFYRGVNSTMVTDEGRVSRFRKRFAGLEALNKISGGETVIGGKGGARPATLDDDSDDEGVAVAAKPVVKPKQKKKK
ncbi:50S ribosomal protein L31, chloroplastic [Auxenochlorella protothecoides]|uniref:Large ribosomal subunit protein bL31c n=1 Tax=Auxenochlorella protothecoides TaxID=3075 RepID=A0A087S9S7_AUXPR|nr:50S ribosomal protein L31, chloroplastic [Auxenochlorella protothecoides]KFM22481.1 50S ribosomal protein L31, chloroplastic [Auxenochlorella protothecoides]